MRGKRQAPIAIGICCLVVLSSLVALGTARASTQTSSGIRGFYASLGASQIACEGAFFSDQPPDLYCDRFRGNTQEVGVHVSGGKTRLGISGGAVEPGANTGPELSAGAVWNAAPFRCEVSATGTTCFDTKTGSGFSMTDSSLKAISHSASTTAACGQKATVIGVRGSGDPQSGEAKTDKYGDKVHGMGNPGAAFAVDLANRLPKGVVTFDPIIFPAAGLLGDLRKVGTWGKFINALGAGAHVGFLGAYTGSVNDGKKALEQTVSDEERICPKIKLVLVGYSQGAQVVGDVYQRNLTSQQRSRIVGVVLFGDPYFNPNDNAADESSFDPTRHGVLGTRGTYPANANGRVFSICHVHDPICQGPGSIDFNQHGNYQSDSWVGTAAAYIAKKLGATPPTGTALTVNANGTAGTLRVDHSSRADVISALGTPNFEYTDTSPPSKPYDALGYGCGLGPNAGAAVGPQQRCHTVFFINQATGHLGTFFTDSSRYVESRGVRIGMPQAQAEDILHKQVVPGCETNLYFRTPTASLTIAFDGGKTTGTPLKLVGGHVGAFVLHGHDDVEVFDCL
jgi:hypothetical protein